MSKGLRVKLRLALFGLVVALLLALPSLAATQTVAGVSIQSIKTIPHVDTLGLEARFVLRDSAGQILAGLTPQNVEFVMEDGSRYPATLANPDYYLAIMLDVSSAMDVALLQMKELAKQAVREAPPNAHIAIITFDQGVHMRQSFTTDKAALLAAIESINGSSLNNCLFDVLLTGIESVTQMAADQPNRSIMLLTGGSDDEPAQSSGCSEASLTDVMAAIAAQPVRPAIHSITFVREEGQESNLAELRRLADVSGGRAIQNDAITVLELIRRVMLDIAGQWIARGDVYAASGAQPVALVATVPGTGLPVSAETSITTDVEYPRPPDPPVVEIWGLTYDSATNVYNMNVRTQNVAAVAAVAIAFIQDIEEGTVSEYMFEQQDQLVVPTDNLVAGEQYGLFAFLFDGEGNLIVDAAGQPVSGTVMVTYNPPPPLTFTVSSIHVDNPEGTLTLLLNLQNGPQVAAFSGFYNTEEGDPREFVVRRGLIENNRLVLALPPEGGDYSGSISAVDEDGEALRTAAFKFNYTPPNLFARLWLGIQEVPVFTWLYAIMAVVTVLWLVTLWAYLRRRRMAPAAPVVEAQAVPVPEEIEPAVRKRRGPTIRINQSPDRQLDSKEISIPYFPYTIGREGCDLSIMGDWHISRRHAEIHRQDDQFFIIDLNSANGTRIDDTPLNANELTMLNGSDRVRIQLGKTTYLTFLVDG